jgi:hypothetical protein
MGQCTNVRGEYVEKQSCLRGVNELDVYCNDC